jgi:nucleoside-diphosphate-sugar epimerase
MNNTVLIGATGFLGSYIAENYSVKICPLRFEDSLEDWIQYSNNTGPVDHVILLSRACQKTHPRRSISTMLLEVEGLSKILQAFPDSHIVYTSTKVVYGLTDNDVRPMSRKQITDVMMTSINENPVNTIVNLPNENFSQSNLSNLSVEHQLYAQTKLVNETLIKNCASTYSIYRIWDITN